VRKLTSWSLAVFWLANCLLAARAQNNTITIQANLPGAAVSSNLFGIFFEEISMAGDGGIYAELIRNRSFEDAATPVQWTLVTNGVVSGSWAIDTSLPLSASNLQCLRLTMTGGLGSIGAANSGYYGIPLRMGSTYDLHFYARGSNGFSGPVSATLESADGSSTYAQASVSGLTTGWQQFSVSMVPNATDPSARLALRISQTGTVYLDFVSLFPAQTFNNRTNGLRPDLANLLENLKPSFMRFPGGSWVDGTSLSNAYHWGLTVGNPANRIERANVWGYMVDNGLGYHEYLQMCEDIGALPLFCVNCGMDVNQNAIAANALGPWVQEALDAIQYANGSTSTPMGAQRAANGHPAPFNLQYIEIGNENNGANYNNNYAYFYTAIKSNYPAMHVIADSSGTIPTSAPVEMVDEHYYNSASTFVSYATKYDNYSRGGPKIFVGEYAVAFAIPPGTFPATLENALGEAAFMTGMERNSDIVQMASYAPLFCNLNNPSWYPDLIYFNGTNVFGTPSYYAQQMFSLNRGDAVLPTTVSVAANATNGLQQGAIGVGSWNTSVQYTNIVVTSNGVTLYQSDFVNSGTNGWRVYNGMWSVNAGLYQQTSATTTDCRSTTGNTNWANYTITLRARRTGGSEGFLILFNWLDDNNWTWWNIGGWGNTLDGIEQMIGGSKSLISPQIAETIANNTWYDIRIVLTGPHVQCYLDNTLVQDINYPSGLVVSSSYSQAAQQIIVKAVNTYSQPLAATFNVTGANSISSNATLIQLTSGSPSDGNSFTAPTFVSPKTNAITSAGTNFTITFPANSLSILRLQSGRLNSFTNLQIQIPSPITTGQRVASTVLGESSGVWTNLTANANHAINYSSMDASIAAVDMSGNVIGVGSGTVNIIATYASLGLSATQSVRVVRVPITLVHRYSSSETSGSTVADSVGGSAWNGALPNGGTLGGGQVVLTSAGQQYVRLPAGILSNYSAVTIEAWVTFPDQLPVNCFFFAFGTTNGSLGENYIFCAPQGGRIAITSSDYSGEQNAYGGFDFSFHTNLHLAAVFNPPAGFISLYTNGVLAGANNSVTVPFSQVNDVYSYIGRSLYSADPYPDFTLDEFRIYNGPLQPAEIQATQVLGPDALLSVNSPKVNFSLAGGGLTLAWPLACAGYTVMSSSNLAAGSWIPVSSPTPQIFGNQWQITLPANQNSQYYRLQK
jgi:alpha-L-arabinofuranosidase